MGQSLEQTLDKIRSTNITKHIEMCLPPFVTREMQIKPCDIELHTHRIEKK